MPKKKPTADIVRSSAAEYLTFVASVCKQADSIELRYEDENIWLTLIENKIHTLEASESSSIIY